MAKRQRIDISVFGKPMVGKTAFSECCSAGYCKKEFESQYEETIGVQYQAAYSNGFCEGYWDTAGQDRFLQVIETYYRIANQVIFCISSVNLAKRRNPTADDVLENTAGEHSEENFQEVDAVYVDEQLRYITNFLKREKIEKNTEESAKKRIIVMTQLDLLANAELRVRAYQLIKQRLGQQGIDYADMVLTSAKENCIYDKNSGEKGNDYRSIRSYFTKHHNSTPAIEVERWGKYYKDKFGRSEDWEKIFYPSPDGTPRAQQEALTLLSIRVQRHDDQAASAVLEHFQLEEKQSDENSVTVENLCLQYAWAGGSFTKVLDLFFYRHGQFKTLAEVKALLCCRAKVNPDGASAAVCKAFNLYAEMSSDRCEALTIENLCWRYMAKGGSYARMRELFFDGFGKFRSIEDARALLQFRANKNPYGASAATFTSFGIALSSRKNLEMTSVSPAPAEGKSQDLSTKNQVTLHGLYQCYGDKGGSFARAQEIFFDARGCFRTVEEVTALLQCRAMHRNNGASSAVVQHFQLAQDDPNKENPTVQALCVAYVKVGGSLTRAQQIFFNKNGQFRTPAEAKLLLSIRAAKQQHGASAAVLKHFYIEQQQFDSKAEKSTEKLCLAYAQHGGSFEQIQRLFFNDKALHSTEIFHSEAEEGLQQRAARRWKTPFSGASEKALQSCGIDPYKKKNR